MKTLTLLRREWLLLVSVGTVAAFWRWGPQLFAGLSNPFWLAFIFLWLFAVILASALAVVRHADALAERLGEPYGTLILTLSVTAVEVMSISAVMLHGANNPTLVRDTLFAVVMIILNGMVGLSLLAGGLRHAEQHYNLQGANAFLGVIIPLAVFSLIMPDFTQTTPGPTLSQHQQIFLIVMSAGLYCAFLAIQTGRHRGFFTLGDQPIEHFVKVREPIFPHAVLLLAYMIPVVSLAEKLAHPIDYLVETLHFPDALGGLLIALLVATPEGIGAAKAALRNQLQRSMNIFLGSVLATIGLTVPAMIAVSHITGRGIDLGLEHTDFVLLLLTLAVSVVTFASGRTNILQGIVHLLLFASYVLLLIEG
ncbi:MAG: calcium:proton antiporter [Methylovirgula sp.]|nr:calcium:proton antiporter [Methylovirgula sp.]